MMFNLLKAWQDVWGSAPRATYSREGMGVPAPVVWRGRQVWRADGTVHCSGAVWWALVELLRRFTNLEEDESMTFDVIEALRLAAWEDLDSFRRGDLPILLGDLGLAEYSQSPPQEGDICQIWRANGSGHLIVCAGYEDGKLLEWSASKHNANGTGIRPFWGSPSEYHTARINEGFFK